MNELKQITRQTCLVYRVLRNADQWTTITDVKNRAGVVERTARGILTALAKEGLVDTYKVHGGFRYKLKTVKTDNAKSLEQRLHTAEKTFGLVGESA
jgi:hypothetical protein